MRVNINCGKFFNFLSSMTFQWKEPKDIWKGEGVYHLTFAVVNRTPLLGCLVSLEQCVRQDVRRRTKLADVEYTPLGLRICHKIEELEKRHPELKICAKVIMPDHIHLVLWRRDATEDSIRQLAKGFAQGCSKIAREVAHSAKLAAHGASVIIAPSDGAMNTNALGGANAPAPASLALDPYECGNGAHTLFSVPYIRTLSRRGQMEAMINYVHANPDNAWMRRLRPDLYVIRRRQEHAGLLFDTMGKARLLDYPDRQVIALSRSLTSEQIQDEVQRALRKAERGVVTYTAAINAGEKAVSKAVREAGFPLVVMMLGGFPPEGSEAARYFHPSGVYHTACGEGLLYLMAPHADNYNHPQLISLTETELIHKAEAKGFRYEPLPHSTTRWRMIAGNVMLKMIAEDGSVREKTAP